MNHLFKSFNFNFISMFSKTKTFNTIKRTFFASLKPKIIFIALPLTIYNLQQKQHCLFSFLKSDKRSNLITNKIDGRITKIQYQSNDPIQDRTNFTQLTAIKGYAAAVFDGHGGFQISDYANKTIFQQLNMRLQDNKGKYINQQELITVSLKQAFDVVETKLLNFAKQSYKLGFPQPARVGSCALVVVVSNNKVYAANSGDSQALLVSQDSTYEALNFKANANNLKQQERLKELFPNEPDLIHCKNNNPKSCYVKGRLQPTKSFGDFRLKWKQFNNPSDFSKSHNFQPRLKIFTGPYITHEPNIKVVSLQKKNKYIVIGSDGLWDELSKKQVTQIVNKNLSTKQKIAQNLLSAALNNVSKTQNIALDELKNIAKGSARRKIHDDISIIGINLENQIN